MNNSRLANFVTEANVFIVNNKRSGMCSLTFMREKNIKDYYAIIQREVQYECRFRHQCIENISYNNIIINIILDLKDIIFTFKIRMLYYIIQ